MATQFPTSEKRITVDSFRSVQEAEAALVLLEDHGLSAELHATDAEGSEWAWDTPIGHIKLRVAESDLKVAMVLLGDWKARRSARDEDGALYDDRCLRCGASMDDNACGGCGWSYGEEDEEAP